MPGAAAVGQASITQVSNCISYSASYRSCSTKASKQVYKLAAWRYDCDDLALHVKNISSHCNDHILDSININISA